MLSKSQQFFLIVLAAAALTSAITAPAIAGPGQCMRLANGNSVCCISTEIVVPQPGRCNGSALPHAR